MDSQDVEGASFLCKILNIPLIDVSWEPSRLPIQVISFRRKTQSKPINHEIRTEFTRFGYRIPS